MFLFDFLTKKLESKIRLICSKTKQLKVRIFMEKLSDAVLSVCGFNPKRELIILLGLLIFFTVGSVLGPYLGFGGLEAHSTWTFPFHVAFEYGLGLLLCVGYVYLLIIGARFLILVFVGVLLMILLFFMSQKRNAS